MDETAIAALYDEALETERAGDRDAAIVAWRKLLLVDPSDQAGAAIRLAALRAPDLPARAPAAYVATLFDQHADTFEITLVDALGYDVPNLGRAATDRLGLGPVGRMLDLGCGTGLAGEAFYDLCGSLTGVDLSPRMIEICAEMGTYSELHTADIIAWLADAAPASYDLITACDLLPYLGNLQDLFTGMARTLSPSGILVISTELAPSTTGWTVTASHRFAHDPGYISGWLERVGLTMRSAETINVRNEDGRPSPGQLIVAQAAG